MNKTIIIFMLVFIPIFCYGAKKAGWLRMSFSEAEDSLLTTPEGVFTEYSKDLNDYFTDITMPAGFRPVD